MTVLKDFATAELSVGFASDATSFATKTGQAVELITSGRMFPVVVRNTSEYKSAGEAYRAGQAAELLVQWDAGETFDIIDWLTAAVDLNKAGRKYVAEIAGSLSALRGLDAFNPLTYGADASGATGSSVAIARCLDELKLSGGGILLFTGGIYVLDQDVALAVDAANVHVRTRGKVILRRTTGSADLFAVTADDFSIRDIILEGPDNTGCDGISLDGCERFSIERVRGFQLASTVVAGLTTECTDGDIVQVFSDDNATQGVHLNKAKSCKLARCRSRGVGTAVGHHGFYVGNCIDVDVTDCEGHDCAGSGLHIFAQSTFAARGIRAKGGSYSGNGTAGSGNRAGVLASAESGSSVEDATLDGIYCFGNGGFNYLIGGVKDIDVADCIANGNAKATTHGFYAESVVAGNRSYRFRGCRSKDHANGFRLVFNSGTIDECSLEDNQIQGNTTGVNASGASLANTFVRPSNRFRANTADISGTVDRSWPVESYVEGPEIGDPGAPAANRGRTYFEDDGAGKTRLIARFPSGAAQVVATEP